MFIYIGEIKQVEKFSNWEIFNEELKERIYKSISDYIDINIEIE